MPKPTPSSPAGSRPRARRGRRALFAMAGVLSGLLAALAAGSIVLLRYVEGGLVREDVAGLEEVLGDRPMNVILLGSDTREGLSEAEQEAAGTTADVGGERSDTMILLHVDPRREKAVLVHFPRDLRVEIPGHGLDKVNAAFTFGGPDLVVETVKRFSGLPIHHYVEVSFVGFKKVVDALGGVEVCVDRPLYDELARLQIPRAGCSVFDGRRALAFVRARHVEGDAIPDFARIARQQQFIRALLNKLLTVRSLLQPSRLRVVTENVTTDAELSATEILSLGEALRDLADAGPSGAGGVDFRVVPAAPESIGGISYVVADEAKTRLLFERMRSGRPLGEVGAVQASTAPSPATIGVRVLDAGNGEGAAAVRARLLRAGFVVMGEVAEAPAGVQRSEILYRPGREDRAEVVGGFLPGLGRRPGTRGVLGRAAVVVVVGADLGRAP